ncbi:hypothetical protein CTA2_11131 [Colletotrichum tanaceti]|uniref:Uncharacterized protein n=1 Tax=Colletotrichum tanaceti TaxID=1306861 RepID=A0A4U6X3P1_9PEZI|nr:hypothetical protein CTA2_11131 [Colletotrichum tanaceti]TKW49389.1 hypothetical protein CTA1_1315 [Colletotrichum tanaceti]
MDEANYRPIREGPPPPPVLDDNDPPPPYVEEEGLPGYPPANHREPVPPGSSIPAPVPAPTLVPAAAPSTSRFPPVLNGYSIDSSWDFHLGASVGQKRFRLRAARPYYLHDGLDTKDPILANLVREACSSQRHHIAVRFPAAAAPEEEEEEEEEEKLALLHHLNEPTLVNRELYELLIDIGGVEERFQWRPSRGKEVKSVGKHAVGWKLVRMVTTAAAQQQQQQQQHHPQVGGVDGGGGWRKRRGEGFSSHWEEVVAVIALTFCEKKKFTFLFLGSGRSGALGEAWQAAALLTGVWRWSTSGY